MPFVKPPSLTPALPGTRFRHSQAGPRDLLNEIAAGWRESALKLDQSQDAAARTKMEKDLAELQARRQLSDLKAVALETVDRFILSAKLADCLTATSTTAISRKSTELTSTMATEEVAAALSEELLALGVNSISVAMQPSSTKAKTTFKLVLKSESGAVPQDILSEGEQRAIAIASFLAEVKLGKGKGGIVFDDPGLIARSRSSRTRRSPHCGRGTGAAGRRLYSRHFLPQRADV